MLSRSSNQYGTPPTPSAPPTNTSFFEESEVYGTTPFVHSSSSPFDLGFDFANNIGNMGNIFENGDAYVSSSFYINRAGNIKQSSSFNNFRNPQNNPTTSTTSKNHPKNVEKFRHKRSNNIDKSKNKSKPTQADS